MDLLTSSKSHRMEEILKIGSKGVVVKLYYMEVKKNNKNILEELKRTLENHFMMFQEIPKGLSPSRYHEHQIELILGSTPNSIFVVIDKLTKYAHFCGIQNTYTTIK